MPGYLITPIKLSNGSSYCVDYITTHRTPILIEGDASGTGNDYTLYECPLADPDDQVASSGRTYSGKIEFGVGCGTRSVSFSLDGLLETKEDAYDYISIRLNGNEVFREASVMKRYSEEEGTYPEDNNLWSKPFETVSNVNLTYTVSITGDRCCGNIIEVFASTGDTVANNGVFWSVSITDIS